MLPARSTHAPPIIHEGGEAWVLVEEDSPVCRNPFPASSMKTVGIILAAAFGIGVILGCTGNDVY